MPHAGLNLVTICVMILRNGHRIVGINAGPVSIANYDEELARKLAREHAVDQIWPLEGYLLKDRLHTELVASMDADAKPSLLDAYSTAALHTFWDRLAVPGVDVIVEGATGLPLLLDRPKVDAELTLRGDDYGYPRMPHPLSVTPLGFGDLSKLAGTSVRIEATDQVTVPVVVDGVTAGTATVVGDQVVGFEPAEAAIHLCPRRGENPGGVFRLPETDTYRADDTCSYCGSLNQDTFMARLEAGDILLGATDKSYKVYVTPAPGSEMLKQTTRIDDRTGDQSKWIWETKETDHGKFYFQHLSIEQRKRFVELFNEKKLKFEGGEGFYQYPFFMVRAEATPLQPNTKSA